MLSGRQLYLLRVRNKYLKDTDIAERLNISVNDILIYEYNIKPIPNDLYEKWIEIIK